MLRDIATAFSYVAIGAMIVVYYQFMCKIEPLCFWLPGGLGKYYKIHKNISTKFNDIVGLSDIKKEIITHLKMFKENKDLSKGFLFTGPSGTGKTMLAKAIAGESGLPFIEIFVKDNSYDHLSAVFNTVIKKHSPCIVFIDECSKIISLMEDTLLRTLDGITSIDNVMIILATNNSVNKSLKRSGRVDKVINFMLPSQIDRYNMLLKMEYSEEKAAEVAKQTNNFSYADLAIIPRETQFIKETYMLTSDEALSKAIDKLTVGRHTTKYITDGSLRARLAYHEIGHLVIAYALKLKNKPRKITIISEGNFAGITFITTDCDQLAMTKTDIIKSIMIYFASAVFEEYYMGEYSTFCKHDFEKISDLFEMLKNNHMFGYEFCYTKLKSERSKIDEVINTIKTIIIDIIKQNSIQIEKLHNELLIQETLNYDQFSVILGEELLNSIDL